MKQQNKLQEAIGLVVKTKNKVLGVVALLHTTKSLDGKLFATSKSAAEVRRRNAANEDHIVRNSGADDGLEVRRIVVDDDQSLKEVLR